MTENDAIARSDEPVTTERLLAELLAGGVPSGEPVLVHTSLSALGWVCGGAVAVVESLQAIITEHGSLLMPTFTNDNSDPGLWQNPPVPRPWWQTIRDHTPAYDPQRTPTRGMGRVPELFRSWPDVVRSDHPTSSFAAWGADSVALTRDHELDFALGEGSPLARLYALDGWVLLLGVGHDNNTSLHLSEARLPKAPVERMTSAISISGERLWVDYLDFCIDPAPFPEIGAAFEAENSIIEFAVGAGRAKLIKQRPLVDFGVRWLAEKHN